MSDYMCPNCVTPWKCNGPHIPEAVSDRPIHEVLAEISAKVPPEEWAKLDKTHYADPDTLATLNRLERENADLRKRLEINPEAPSYDGISCRDETIRLLDKQVADLRAQLEAAQRDAERYRWLRAAEVIPFNIMHIEYMGEVLDARIDAAKEERSEQLSADGLRISACSVDAVDREERDAQG